MHTDLIHKLEAYDNNKTKLSKSKMLYLANLPIYLNSRHKNDENNNSWTPICSDLLKNIKNYSKYISFLIDNGFFEKHKSNYSSDRNQCNKYRIHSKYSKQVIQFQSVKAHSNFTRGINKSRIDRESIANKSCKHLTKWLIAEKFTINYNEAAEYLKTKYAGTNNLKKRNNRIVSIDEIKNNIFTYSRNGRDNRLHSNLTRLAKDLRKFVKYDNEFLYSEDISNCQPYIVSNLINKIKDRVNNRGIKNNIDSYHNHIIDKYTPIMSDHFDQDECSKEIERFSNLMLNGSFYEDFSNYLYEDGIISLFYNDSASYTSNRKIYTFKNKRDASKAIFLKTLYSSKKSKENIINTFKMNFPYVYEIIQTFKTEDKSDFPIMIQNIEADCIIDYCTKILAKKYPKMPLFTIHDSILTTESYSDILNKEVKILLSQYFESEPNLKSEHWCPECLDVA
ncbi:hypothetical protein ITJ86_15470 [Winogradskyella sp. F6397]|uniref:DNA-directed RNA polymerase n=1 Tax=Winogradskyella marina TaxID=2785530 RepID=A0ABS0EME4_9FLAO|nr:hypothetical protein [Winogradskyella marina]MBF8151306.1 hypothetical protein [Winogradskyella marina]